MTTPSSRWHRVFAAALDQRAAVAVQVAVSDHLGRLAGHSEANAARRAAHSFAAAGHARLEHASVTQGGQRDRLVLVRAEVETTPDLLAAALSPTGTPFVSMTARAMHTDAAQRLVDAVREAAAQARHIRADTLDRSDGAVLADALGDALGDLTRFRRQLRRPVRRAASGPGRRRRPTETP